jgi:hypothetical protein
MLRTMRPCGYGATLFVLAYLGCTVVSGQGGDEYRPMDAADGKSAPTPVQTLHIVFRALCSTKYSMLSYIHKAFVFYLMHFVSLHRHAVCSS